MMRLSTQEEMCRRDAARMAGLELLVSIGLANCL